MRKRTLPSPAPPAPSTLASPNGIAPTRPTRLKALSSLSSPRTSADKPARKPSASFLQTTSAPLVGGVKAKLLPLLPLSALPSAPRRPQTSLLLLLHHLNAASALLVPRAPTTTSSSSRRSAPRHNPAPRAATAPRPRAAGASLRASRKTQ